MKKVKQTNLLGKLEKKKAYKEICLLIEKQNLDFPEEMDFIYNLPEKDREIYMEGEVLE